MAKDFAKRFYHSKLWLDCRDGYFVSQHGLCERCEGAGLIVHHVIELTPENINNPEITLNWDNLELTCLPCHNGEHHGSPATVDGLVFDANGELVSR